MGNGSCLVVGDNGERNRDKIVLVYSQCQPQMLLCVSRRKIANSRKFSNIMQAK